MKDKQGKRSPLHDNPLRYAGQSLDAEIERINFNDIIQPIIYATSFSVLAITAWVNYIRILLNPFILTLAAIIALFIATIKLISARKKKDQLILARDGEKIVAENLDILKRDGDTVFHDILGDHFNIDHVVLSLHGIFIVETKTRSKSYRKNPSVVYDGKRVLIDGRESDRNPVEQVIAQANWLSKQIQSSTGKQFPIRPVIVFPGWFVEPSSQDTPVWVLNPKALPSFIQREPISISESDLCLLSYHLSRIIRSNH
jgi:Nuclease-related domain.